MWRFLILYGALYAGFGVQSPYLPTLLESRNLGPEALAFVLGASTAIRLIAGPVAGRSCTVPSILDGAPIPTSIARRLTSPVCSLHGSNRPALVSSSRTGAMAGREFGRWN
jgi:hypothetical protein